MATKTECPFCNLNERVLKENGTAQAFLSNPRKVPGHFLVTPKRHIEKPWELTDEELKDVFELIFFVEQKLIGKVGDGVDIRQNYRPYKPQGDLKVNHLLFHVIPRYKNDYLYQVSEQYEKDLFTELDEGEQGEFAKLLKG
jgi:diadenosine tetraphosphate (Ap4A) HIT family hydrolase